MHPREIWHTPIDVLIDIISASIHLLNRAASPTQATPAGKGGGPALTHEGGGVVSRRFSSLDDLMGIFRQEQDRTTKGPVGR